MTILLTGATGFVGAALCECLCHQGQSVIAAIRHNSPRLPSSVQHALVGDLLPDTAWMPVLNNVDVVIHLAARAHIMHDTVNDPLAAFRETNTQATLNLAQQAADAGTRRFIYLSSIKVNGEFTTDTPFVSDSDNIPSDPYGLSKYEAEQGLREIAQQTGMEVVIIRPPLVYGAGVKGNFLSMLRWLERGVPLPLALVNNLRSLVCVDNLIDLIMTCVEHPSAANQTFLVSDGEDVSTSQLLRCMGKALGKPARLIPIPPKLLKLGAGLLGKSDITQRLLGNLQVDITKTKTLLNWTPPLNVDEGLRKTAKWYLQRS